MSLKSSGLFPLPVGTQRRKGCPVGFVCTPPLSHSVYSSLRLALPVSSFKSTDTRGVAAVPSSCYKIPHLCAGLSGCDGKTMGKPSPVCLSPSARVRSLKQLACLGQLALSPVLRSAQLVEWTAFSREGGQSWG